MKYLQQTAQQGSENCSPKMLTFYNYLASGENAIPNICKYRTNLQLAKKNICPDKLQTKQNLGDTSELQADFQMLWVYFHNPERVYAA